MADVADKRWRIYCETEGAWVQGTGASAPSTCYNDAGHTVTTGSADRLSKYSHVDLSVHYEDASSNPHAVTAAQLGLGNVANVKMNLVATAAPGATDDSAAGYAIGSRWVDTASDAEYVCVDDTATAAVWTETTQAVAGGGQLIALWTVSDDKTTGTNGGTFTSGAWRTRALNTLAGDASTDVTLSSNQITMQPGTYSVRAVVPAYNVKNHQARLRNVTDGADALLGTTAYDKSGMSHSVIVGRLVLASAKTFEVQHQCEKTRKSTGLGVATGFGVGERYTAVSIAKVAAS